MIRRVALIATIAAAAWAAALTTTGGFDVDVFGLHITAHDPLRPFLWGTLALGLFVLTNGAARTARSWTQRLARLNRPWVAIALAIWTTVLGVRYGTTTGTAADAYGYVSQADLWLRGDLKLRQPWIDQVPWPAAAWTFSPLGHKPVELHGVTTVVPTYGPGLPLLMAGAKAIAGHCAMFWVVPLSGGIFVLTSYLIGRRLGAPGAGLIAAWLVATSPVFLFMLMPPMIDVPAAAAWALAFYLLMRRGTGAAFAAGLVVSLAVLIRTNLVVLSGVFAFWLLLRAWRTEGHWHWRLLEPLAFGLGMVPGLAISGVVFNSLYGSPFVSGYGAASGYFALTNLRANLGNYLTWMIQSQTPLALVGLLAAFVPLRRLWPAAPDRQVLLASALFVAALWTFYGFYLVLDTWWSLRLFLACWPFIMLGLASVLIFAARAGGAWMTVFVTWLVVALGAYDLRVASQRGVFEQWRGERRFVAIARLTKSLTDDNSVVFSLLHSGTLRYYGGRITLRYDSLDKDWLDRSVEWLSAHGAHAYALLEQWEVAEFKQRFAGQRLVGQLDTAAVFVSQGANTIALYDLAQPASAPARVVTEFDVSDLRCATPAAEPTLILKPGR